MRLGATAVLLVAALAASSAGGPARTSATALIECQHPVRTGVEVYVLRRVERATACRLALELFAWENPRHARVLYGCHRPAPEAAGYPYLKLRHFRGWTLSLRGRPYGAFTMSRGDSSFEVTGTDFPLNCT